MFYMAQASSIGNLGAGTTDPPLAPRVVSTQIDSVYVAGLD